MKPVFLCAAAFVATLALAGCATGTGGNPQDPLEGFNRVMFSFNDNLDQAALKPAATAYREVLPTPLQNGIGNFFGNIGDVWTAVNNLLQGKLEDGLTDVMRVALNSTLGLFGLIDLGSDLGMQKHNQDFGATLGVWGVGPGPYVVLPFLGSTTMRDTIALPADFKGDLWQNVTPVKYRNSGSLVRVVDQRSVVLNASNLIEDAALDRYEFVRDAYLQRRANQINNGESRKPRNEEERSSGVTNDTTLTPASVGSLPVALKEPSGSTVVQLTERPPQEAVATSEDREKELTIQGAQPPIQEAPAQVLTSGPVASPQALQNSIRENAPTVSSNSAAGQLTKNLE